MGQEDVLRKGIEEDAVAGANNGRALAGDIVSHRETRREVLVVLVVETRRSTVRADLRQRTAVGWRQLVEEVVLLAGHAKVVPAQAVVHGQALGPSETVLYVQALVVLSFVAIGIAFRLAATRGQSCEERSEVGEAQPAAEIGILNEVDRRAAELVSELPGVPPNLPRVVVNEMPVCVHPLPWNPRACAEDRKRSHRDFWQSAVVWGHAGVQADRRWIKALVFREESFDEAVPAETRFVDLRGVDDFHPRERHQLHGRRRNGVKAGKQSAR